METCGCNQLRLSQRTLQKMSPERVSDALDKIASRIMCANFFANAHVSKDIIERTRDENEIFDLHFEEYGLAGYTNCSSKFETLIS